MRINLANYEVLPNLVQGKVIALNCPYGKQLDYTVGGRKISLLTIGKYTVQPDGPFKPEYYEILNTKQYTVLVNSKQGPVLKAVTDYLNAKQNSIVEDLMNYVKSHQPENYRIGDKIHLKEKMGVYIISNIEGNDVWITCKKWQYNPKESDRFRKISMDSIKCLAGGLHNFNRK
jgi:hypothetical protein